MVLDSARVDESSQQMAGLNRLRGGRMLLGTSQVTDQRETSQPGIGSHKTRCFLVPVFYALVNK